MMTREDFTREAKASADQEMQTALTELRGVRERLIKEFAEKRGKTDLLTLLMPRR